MADLDDNILDGENPRGDGEPSSRLLVKKDGPMVSVKGLCKSFHSGKANSISACDHVGIRVDRGEMVAISGPSGSGKSTLLHLIGALDVADAGSIEVNGLSLSGLRRRELVSYRRTVGFVFQRFHLLPTLTATDNVIAPVLPYKTPFDKRARGRELLKLVGLEGREDALPSKLSGGQQQRVAIARALINDPTLILADEPTGNLDTQTGREIVDLLIRLREESGTTLLIATHDSSLASRCDRIIYIRDGRLVERSREVPA